MTSGSIYQKLDREKPVIMTGDLNVAHEEIDLKNPKQIKRMPVLRRKKEINLRNF